MSVLYSKTTVQSICIALLLVIQPISALHEDQAGTWDWYKPFLGRVTHSIFSTIGGHRKRAYVATEDGTVSAIQLRTGEPIWRQPGSGPEDGVDHLLLSHGDRSLLTLSTGVLIRSWGPADGMLWWEHRLHSPATPLVGGGTALLGLTQDLDNDDIADFCTLANGLVQLRSMDDGTKMWSVNLTDHVMDTAMEGSEFFSLAPHPQDPAKLLALGRLAGDGEHKGLVTLEIRLDSGQIMKERSVSGSVKLSTSMTIMGSHAVVLSEDGTGLLTTSAVSQSESPLTSQDLKTLLKTQDTKKKSHPPPVARSLASMDVLLDSAAPHHQVLKLELADRLETTLLKMDKQGQLSLVSRQVGGVISSSLALRGDKEGTVGAHVAGVISTSPVNGSTMFQVMDVSTGSAVWSEEIPGVSLSSLGGPQSCFLNAFQRKDATFGFRVLVVAQDATLMLLQQGAEVWVREESLASVQRAHFADLPPEGGVGSGAMSLWSLLLNGPVMVEQVLPQLLDRLRLQWMHLKLTLKMANKEEIAELVLNRRSHGVKLRATWDSQGFRKMLLLMTRPGKLLALHNGDGRVLWSTFLGRTEGGVGEGAATGAPHTTLLWRLPPEDEVAPELLTVGAAHGNTTIVNVVDTWTGSLLSTKHYPFPVRRVMTTQLVDSQGTHVSLLVGEDRSALILPNTTEAAMLVLDHLSTLFYYEVDEENDSISGYSFTHSSSSSSSSSPTLGGLHLWTVPFPEKLLTHAVRAAEDTVHSHTRILGDRSTLYKYLNPNTLFVATAPAAHLQNAPGAEPHITAYLLDTVSGRLLYRVRHQGATGPVQAAFSEHWVVYHYWNVHASRHEVSVLEIYDDDATRRAPSLLEAVVLSAVGGAGKAPMSSLSLPVVRVLGQSYFFSLGVKAMGVTSTHKGITSKHLLLATSTDQVLALEKRFLDPRRPTKPTPLDREEGLVPYNPNLPIIPHHIITTNHQVAGLRGILTAPSRLESTSLVFAYGLDLFYTRVTPSKMYDTLDDHEFSYALLVLTIVSLLVGTLVAGLMVQQKELANKWK